MEFPDDVLSIIKDFSRPMTRSDWRSLHRMTAHRFHRDILIRYNKRKTRPPVIYTFVMKYYYQPKDIYIYEFAYINRSVAFLVLQYR